MSGTIGSISGSASSDFEIEILCDDNGPFIRRVVRDSLGNVTEADLALDCITPYAPVGQVKLCTTTASDIEVEVLCDNATSFLRHYIRDGSSGTIIASDTDLDGVTAYVPVGAVTRCSTAVDQLNSQVLCDTVSQFLRHYLRNGKTGIFTVSDTTLDGVTAYAPVGLVTLCLNKSDQLSVERLCDSNGAFFRYFIRDAAGVITSSDVALDGITAYAPVGTVTDCGQVKKCNTCR